MTTTRFAEEVPVDSDEGLVRLVVPSVPLEEVEVGAVPFRRMALRCRGEHK
jgi:hypothetical protein